MQYHLLEWLGTAPQLNAGAFDNFITQLKAENFLQEKPAGLLLTEIGLKEKENYEHIHYRPKNPEFFQKLDEKMWGDVLQLLIQVGSELSYCNKRYYVSATSYKAQFYFKRWFQQNKSAGLSKTIKKNLLSFLAGKLQEEADIFAASFNGHGVIAKTAVQLAKSSETYTVEDINTLWRDYSVMFAMYLIKQNDVFYSLVKPLLKNSLLSNSAFTTYELFNKGVSLEKIGQLRKVKLSTVKEHLLEAAIFEHNFTFERIINQNEYKILADNFSEKAPLDWNYQQLKEKNIQLDFFKFRLFQIERSRYDF